MFATYSVRATMVLLQLLVLALCKIHFPVQAETFSSYANSAACCASLASALPSEVFNQNSTAYSDTISTYWSLQEQALRPSCVVYPTNSNDVAVIVKTLTQKTHATGGTCRFAIKSGGHAPFAGAANVNHGVLIDLAKLTEITFSKDKKTVVVGTGNRWGPLGHYLDTYGVSVPSGRIAPIGVGGYTLGGGISWYSPRVGFVCDTVLSYTIVLASGTVTTANATHNRDLFTALKGGSNNFGIVTSFTLPLIHTGPIWAGTLTIPFASLETTYTFLEKFTHSATYDPYAAIVHQTIYVNGSWIVAVITVNTRSGESNPSVFAPLARIPGTTSDAKLQTQAQYADVLATEQPAAGQTRTFFRTLNFANSAAYMSAFFALVNQTVAELTNVRDFKAGLVYQGLPQLIFEHGRAAGGDSFGVTEEDGDMTNINVNFFWSAEEDDVQVYAATDELFEEAEKLARDMGVWRRWLYMNYADKGQRVMERYGEKSLEKLRAVSRSVDPDGVFQKNAPGGFKLW